MAHPPERLSAMLSQRARLLKAQRRQPVTHLAPMALCTLSR